MKSGIKILLAASAFAASAAMTTAQAADFDPVVQYSDWAFRFERVAGYSDFTTDVTIDGITRSQSFDGLALNSGFSASFQGPVLWTQLDGAFGLTDYTGAAEAEPYTQFSGGVHMGWRDHSVGMLAVNVAATGEDFGGAGVDRLRVGGVGEFFFNQFTLGAGGGFITDLGVDDGEDAYVKGLARWYVTDNFKIEGHGGAVFQATTDLIYGRALAEWKPDDSRISYFARWDGVFVDGNFGVVSQTVDSHTVSAGIRIYFSDPSTTTVKEQDRVHFADSCAFGAAGQFISIC